MMQPPIKRDTADEAAALVEDTAGLLRDAGHRVNGKELAFARACVERALNREIGRAAT
ncbi:hypothetical protein [Sphingomonas fennica]|uniref:hypothetical protein n=1 Tax=Edaphosphingomonas fennica TaxID=114404 RepID=UPI001473754A|nr:hypothetical protein [Sphingomonas fennica]